MYADIYNRSIYKGMKNNFLSYTRVTMPSVKNARARAEKRARTRENYQRPGIAGIAGAACRALSL